MEEGVEAVLGVRPAGNFSGPLGPGTYTFLAAEGSGTPESYSFDFQISAVPEPTAGTLTALGLVGLALRSRRRRAART